MTINSGTRGRNRVREALMPIFEYVCRSCEHEFEELVRAANEAAPPCPRCGKRKVERRISVFAARQGQASDPATGGGCGRCGDPSGPCGM